MPSGEKNINGDAMKTLGLIGGTSWTSTVEYYRFINEEVGRRRGGLHSAKLLLASIDFAELEEAMRNNKPHMAERILLHAAGQLTRACVDGIMLCSNLIHRYYPALEAAVNIPILHICDALSAGITRQQYRKVALLGTRATMEEDFYRSRILEQCGVDIIVPDEQDRAYIHTAIFERMCRNIYTNEDRIRISGMIDSLKEQGAQGVMLSCTELPVLLSEASLPLLDSTRIHSHYAVAWALGA